MVFGVSHLFHYFVSHLHPQVTTNRIFSTTSSLKDIAELYEMTHHSHFRDFITVTYLLNQTKLRTAKLTKSLLVLKNCQRWHRQYNRATILSRPNLSRRSRFMLDRTALNFRISYFRTRSWSPGSQGASMDTLFFEIAILCWSRRQGGTKETFERISGGNIWGAMERWEGYCQDDCWAG